MPPFPSPTPVRIDAWEMRCRFNRGRFYERVLAGELVAGQKADRHPAPPASGQPHCTRSQEVIYYDSTGRQVARVHQYLRPDGALGGSGKPDPKRLLQNGVLYALTKGGAADPEFAPPFLVVRLWCWRIYTRIRCLLLRID